jgi:hypothetical protein
VTIFYRRRPAAWQETAASVIAAASVGALTFYVTRMLLARDAVPAEPPRLEDGQGGRDSRRGARKRLRRSGHPEAGTG